MIDSSQDVESTSLNWVWVPDKNTIFKKGHIIENLEENKVKVKFENSDVSNYSFSVLSSLRLIVL